MTPILARGLPLAALLVAVAAWGTPAAPAAADAAPAAPAFHVYHYGSDLAGTAFREVFLVHDVAGGLDAAIGEVEVRRDGEPLAVAWEDADGRLSVGDRFSFVQEAFDEKQVLTAFVGATQVMECRFGGGAGIGFTPQEWRAMGLPEAVRCLQLTDDQ